MLNNGTNADTVTNITGNLLLPKTPQLFSYDADGNLTSDGLWTNIWNGENRLIATERLSSVTPSRFLLPLMNPWSKRRSTQNGIL